MRTSILFGPPGTGKTTALLALVQEHLDRGVPPDRIAFFAFTRKAANEAKRRACKEFGLKDDDLPWFRTLHSAAFKMLGLSSSEVMQPSHYTSLGKAMNCGVTFEHEYNEETERVPQGGALGDRLLGIYSLARSKCTDIENEWAVNDSDAPITLGMTHYFENSLDEYKRAYALLDFSDFLDEVHTALDLDLLIIDEAQDLTRQQWAFARRIGAKAKKVVIAGDDDQAIFQWAGADVKTFLSLKGALHVLPVSYRLPGKIWGKCAEIAKGIRHRKAKDWQPREGDSGSLTYVEYPSSVDLRNGESWLLLSRLNWQLEMYEEACIAQGVVYHAHGMWSNQTRDVRAVFYYDNLRRRKILTGHQAALLQGYIPNLVIPKLSEVTWDDIKWPFEGQPDWHQALVGLGASARDYIRLLRANGESLVNPGRITLSTIHGVKGGEADNVLVLPDISRKVERGMQNDPDQEARVWYVAASRAKHNLYLSQPTSTRHVRL